MTVLSKQYLANSNIEDIVSTDTNSCHGEITQTILNTETQITSRLYPFTNYIVWMNLTGFWDIFIPIDVLGLYDTVLYDTVCVFVAINLGKRKESKAASYIIHVMGIFIHVFSMTS